MAYGDKWRAHRRVLQRYFGTSSSPQHVAIQRKNNRIFLHALLTEPARLEEHIRRSAAANVLTMSYGINIAVRDDPLIALAEEAEHSIISSGLPGSFAVDMFPIRTLSIDNQNFLECLHSDSQVYSSMVSWCHFQASGYLCA